MFYNKKLLFFIIVYLMSAALYHFINKQLILTGVISGFVLISLVTYGIIIMSCFVLALIFLILFRYSYALGCHVFKAKRKALLNKFFWITFSCLTYLLIFIVFLKATEY